MTGKSEVVSDRRYHGFADRRFIVEAEPNGFADRWGAQFADWDKLG